MELALKSMISMTSFVFETIAIQYVLTTICGGYNVIVLIKELTVKFLNFCILKNAYVKMTITGMIFLV